MIMSEPLELQAQRPYALDQLTMLQSQIMQTMQGMVVLRARIEKQRRMHRQTVSPRLPWQPMVLSAAAIPFRLELHC